ncbi:hypothetical protein L6452_02499 [Arctium lappa]|uniref:Uncharacterized protein n=1 Tax=Arctium lappa TaxID=4217 RepID=A0ACB9FJS2_ARCLA|nr:hypothetical protein L6452_02499 [Arctium lappa]
MDIALMMNNISLCKNFIQEKTIQAILENIVSITIHWCGLPHIPPLQKDMLGIKDGNATQQVQSRAPTLAYDPRRHSDAGPSRSRRDPMIKMNADLYLAWKDDWREKLKRTRSLQDRNDRLAAENKKLKESIKEANKSIFNRFSRIVDRVINWAKEKPSTSETLRIDHHRSSSGSRHRRH